MLDPAYSKPNRQTKKFESLGNEWFPGLFLPYKEIPRCLLGGGIDHPFDASRELGRAVVRCTRSRQKSKKRRFAIHPPLSHINRERPVVLFSLKTTIRDSPVGEQPGSRIICRSRRCKGWTASCRKRRFAICLSERNPAREFSFFKPLALPITSVLTNPENDGSR